MKFLGEFLKLLWAATTVFLFTRLMPAISSRKDYSYSSDTIELQRLIDMTSLIAKNDMIMRLF